MTYFLTKPMRALWHYLFILFFIVWGLALAQPCQDATTITPTTTAGAFNATTTMQTCYAPGASTTVSFAISPKEADLNAPRAVVVFDIVSNDEGDAFPSRIMQVIDVRSLSVKPDIFRDSIEMSLVQAGLEGEITFNMRDNAPVGNYTLVISVFRLPEGLRPGDVVFDRNALAGRVFYGFRIEK
jgi:hypothetical protein